MISKVLVICMGVVFVRFCPASAQPVLFDFDNIPAYTPFPVNETINGITAHFSGTGQGYSIQNANVLGFTPQGFAGNIIYPNSINIADLLINFDQTITDFSIMYSCQELGCDDAATMRVTAFMNGNVVGTNTMTAMYPGTWPVDTLSCSFPQGFDSVVVHYDSPPPTCQDYGVIFMADNMWVNQLNTSSLTEISQHISDLIIPNPLSKYSTISFNMLHKEHINISVYDLTGRLINNLYDGELNAGEQTINTEFKTSINGFGAYFLCINGDHFSKTFKLIVTSE